MQHIINKLRELKAKPSRNENDDALLCAKACEVLASYPNLVAMVRRETDPFNCGPISGGVKKGIQNALDAFESVPPTHHFPDGSRYVRWYCDRRECVMGQLVSKSGKGYPVEKFHGNQLEEASA